MGLFGKRRDATQASAATDKPAPPTPRRPVVEDNTVTLMRGVEDELAAVAPEARSAVETFLGSLRANCRPEGRTAMDGMAVEGYRMEIAGYRVIWSMNPAMRGKVLVMRIVKLS